MMSKTHSILSNARGSAIIQVLILSGLMLIVSLAVGVMIQMAQRQAQHLENKLAAVELEKILVQMTEDPASCTRNVSNLSFDSTMIGTSNAPLFAGITQIFLDSVNSELAVRLEDPASPASPHLIVKSIAIKNFQSTTTANRYQADIEIGFETRNTVTLKPLQIPITLQTDPSSPATAKTILSCGGNPLIGTPYTYTNCAWLNPPRWGRDSFCPAGKVATGMCGTGRDADCVKNGVRGWGSLYCCDMVFQ